MKAKIVKDNSIEKILDEPYNPVESNKYISCEGYFIALLIEKKREYLFGVYKN